MRNCTIQVAKTRALISFAVTAKLICAFVFAYADCWFSHEATHFKLVDAGFVSGFYHDICIKPKNMGIYWSIIMFLC